MVKTNVGLVSLAHLIFKPIFSLVFKPKIGSTKWKTKLVFTLGEDQQFENQLGITKTQTWYP
jgi:hypothetical protein